MPVMSSLSPLAHGTTSDEWRSAHAAIKQDDALWPMLGFAGIQPDGHGQLYDSRHCPCCRSTLLRSVSYEEAFDILGRQAALVEQSRELVATASATATQPPSQHDTLAEKTVPTPHRPDEQSRLDALGRPGAPWGVPIRESRTQPRNPADFAPGTPLAS